MKMMSPAGVRPGDVLVSTWSGPAAYPRLPDGWIDLGRTEIGDPNNGGVYLMEVAYHVLSDAESDDTTYMFEGAHGSITTLAFRNASPKQPVTPLAVTKIQAQDLDGGRAALDAPPLETRSISRLFYVFANLRTTTFPTLPGLDLVETTGGLAAYCAQAVSPPLVTVPGPHLEITVNGGAPNVMVAALAVVVGP
jgi:hypothetical protein